MSNEKKSNPSAEKTERDKFLKIMKAKPVPRKEPESPAEEKPKKPKKAAEAPAAKEAEPKKKPKKKISAYNTLSYRDVSGTTLDPTKKLFLSFEDRLKGDEKPLKEIAVDKLRAGLEQNVQTIFKGTVEGSSYIVDPNTNKKTFFVLVNSNCNTEGYQGRIIRIRLEDFIAPSCTDTRYGEPFLVERASDAEINAYINSRKESEIEFCVTGMDLNKPYTGFVTGSRTMALARRRKKYWYGRTTIKGNPNPVFLLDEGSILDTRIVAVTYRGVFVEMYGLEAFIPLSELTHMYLENARTAFEVNGKLSVMITNIKRYPTGKITMEVSHKKTIENPAPSFMAQYRPNDVVQGIVTRLFWDAEKSKTIAFVNIDDKFEIRCTMKGGITRTPLVGDKVDVLIVDADIDLEKNTGKMWGLINHIRSEFALD